MGHHLFGPNIVGAVDEGYSEEQEVGEIIICFHFKLKVVCLIRCLNKGFHNLKAILIKKMNFFIFIQLKYERKANLNVCSKLWAFCL